MGTIKDIAARFKITKVVETVIVGSGSQSKWDVVLGGLYFRVYF